MINYHIENADKVDYHSRFMNNFDNFMNSLKKNGESKLKEEISGMNMKYSEGKLLSGVGSRIDSKSVTIYDRAEDVAFVEFGTGIYGDPSAKGLENTSYTPNEYSQGNGWIYTNNAGTFYTEGYESRPFMHKTFEKIKDNVVNEVAKEEFKKW